MIPLALVAELPAPLATIEKFAGISQILRYNLTQIPNTFAFLSWLYQEFPGTSRDQAWSMFRAAQYFRDQGRYLGTFGPSDTFDVRLAGTAFVKPGDFSRLYPHRFNMTIDFIDPRTGVAMRRNLWVRAGSGDTVADIKSAAVAELVARYKDLYRFVMPTDFATVETTRISINQFDVFTTRRADVQFPS